MSGNGPSIRDTVVTVIKVLNFVLCMRVLTTEGQNAILIHCVS